MAPSTQVSSLNKQQCNSAPSILASGTSHLPPLEDIRDILSIIKSTTTRLSPQNAHWCLRSTHQGLDCASSKLQNFQDELKGAVPTTVGLDGDTANAFYDVCDVLLDVVRAVERVPVAVAHSGKFKLSLKEQWKFLKSFGPSPCEKQQHLREIYCSMLDVVIKVQSLNYTLPHLLTSANLIEDSSIFERKRIVLTKAFAQSFGTEPLKSNTSCDIGLPLPALISRGSQAPTQVFVGGTRVDEIRRRSDSLSKAVEDAKVLGLSRRGWTRSLPAGEVTMPVRISSLLETSPEVTVDVQEVDDAESEVETPPTALFKPINYSPELVIASKAPKSECHAPTCSHAQSLSKEPSYFDSRHAPPLSKAPSYFDSEHRSSTIISPSPPSSKSKIKSPAPPEEQQSPSTTSQPAQPPPPPPQPKRTESKPRMDSAHEFLPSPDLSSLSFKLNGFNRYSDAGLVVPNIKPNPETGCGGVGGYFDNFDSEAEETPMFWGMKGPSPPVRGRVEEYFDF